MYVRCTKAMDDIHFIIDFVENVIELTRSFSESSEDRYVHLAVVSFNSVTVRCRGGSEYGLG